MEDDNLMAAIKAIIAGGISLFIALVLANNLNPFVSDRGGEYRHMRLIPKPTKRLMKPIELAGRWLDFGSDGMSIVCGFDDGAVCSSHDSFDVADLDIHDHGCIGWRDTPTSELNTSFEVDE